MAASCERPDLNSNGKKNTPNSADRHPLRTHDTKLVHHVRAQDLERDNERILQQIVVHAAVEHVDGAVVCARCEQGQRLVETDAPHTLCVVAQHFVGQVAAVHVVPTHATVVRARQDVIAARMHGQAAEPLRITTNLLAQRLRGQIENAHLKTRRNDQVWARGVELGKKPSVSQNGTRSPYSP